MPLNFDAKETIKNATRDLKLGRLMRMATYRDNRCFESVLKKAGLSQYIDQFRERLEPYSYNFKNNITYQNSNNLYSPETVFDFFYEEIGQNDKEHQFIFLRAIVEEIKNMDYEEKEYFNKYLVSLGYSIFEVDCDPIIQYSLQQMDIIITDDCDSITKFEEECEQMAPGSFIWFNEALSTFRNSDFSSSISNCRKVLEQVLDGVTGIKKTGIAIFKLSKAEYEAQTHGIEIHDINQAIKHWGEKRNIVCKFMRLYTLYNFECDFGSHPSNIPTYEDALLVLRETQSTIHWIYQNK